MLSIFQNWSDQQTAKTIRFEMHQRRIGKLVSLSESMLVRIQIASEPICAELLELMESDSHEWPLGATPSNFLDSLKSQCASAFKAVEQSRVYGELALKCSRNDLRLLATHVVSLEAVVGELHRIRRRVSELLIELRAGELKRADVSDFDDAG